MSNKELSETDSISNLIKDTKTYTRSSSKINKNPIIHLINYEPQIMYTIKHKTKTLIIVTNNNNINIGDLIYLIPSTTGALSQVYKTLPKSNDKLLIKVINIREYDSLALCYKTEPISRIYPWLSTVDEAINCARLFLPQDINIRSIHIIEFSIM